MASCGAPDGCLSNPSIKFTTNSVGSHWNNEVHIIHAEGISYILFILISWVLFFVFWGFFYFKCDLVIEYNREYYNIFFKIPKGTFIIDVVSTT